ncbi:ATP-binding cassette domain-containing protein [Nocardia sp. NPDC051570]
MTRSVAAEENFAPVGQNGAGKSTLLGVLSGLLSRICPVSPPR